ncbi:hypothetical protein J1N35_019289 [Gossypium stocksii]|uniref:DUF4283 domain-containing protein n=1 Tax=Gossypium stocksii TaxID=47602 RepID=A0A9D4A5R6_9ROSI|nr:hypothetical protein J1N35_019289 [Gossypium stocksii]
MVQPWTKEFSPLQPFSNVVLAWIRLHRLPGYMYKMKTLGEIGSMFGRFTKLDFNNDSKTRGHVARMVVYVNLDKPLMSQVLINGKTQQVEYESLPMICFSCDRHGHVKELCSTPIENMN